MGIFYNMVGSGYAPRRVPAGFYHLQFPLEHHVDDLGFVVDFQLAVDILDVEAHGVERYVQSVGDSLVAVAFG